MNEENYRALRIKLEQERNEILKGITEKLDSIDHTLWECLASAEVGDALKSITAIPGMTIGVDIPDTLDVQLVEEE